MKTKSSVLKLSIFMLLSTGCAQVVEKFSDQPDQPALVSTSPHADHGAAVFDQQRQTAGVMAQAHRQMAESIEAVWGEEDVQMPSRKVWVQYDKQMKTRTIIDFERGELRVEHLMTPDEPEELAHQMIEFAVHQARDETIVDLGKLDLEMQLAHRIARQLDMDIAEVSASAQDASMRVLEGLIDDEDMMSIDDRYMEMLPLKGSDKPIRTAQKMNYRIQFKPGFRGTLARRYLEHVLEYSRSEDISPAYY